MTHDIWDMKILKIRGSQEQGGCRRRHGCSDNMSTGIGKEDEVNMNEMLLLSGR